MIDEQTAQVEVQFSELKHQQAIAEKARQAQGLSRTLEMGNKPQENLNFVEAFGKAVQNGQNHTRLSPEIMAQYSSVIKYGNDSNASERFSDKNSQERTNNTLSDFYKMVDKEGRLTIENLGEFYDKLTSSEPFLDSNTRTSIIALTHVLTQYGYETPVFDKDSHDLLQRLRQAYPRDYRKAKTEFLRRCIPDSIPSRTPYSEAA